MLASIVVGASLALSPPLLPKSFQVDVFQQAYMNARYTWKFDFVHKREAKLFTTNVTTVNIYHDVPDCDKHNGCCTTYNFGQSSPCHGFNLSNNILPAFSWLTDDEFTHEQATFVGFDAENDCDVWQHNSKPVYPTNANQTVCIANQTTAGGVAYSAPVYLHFRSGSGGSTAGDSNTTYTNFQLVDAFDPAAFTHPDPCPVQHAPE